MTYEAARSINGPYLAIPLSAITTEVIKAVYGSEYIYADSCYQHIAAEKLKLKLNQLNSTFYEESQYVSICNNGIIYTDNLCQPLKTVHLQRRSV
ncbi:MAG: hypothetical protein BWK80_26460 [Desulfobacteraceae bacterium IS3]|nr:MAG: hypothetical protein BWK80_26460 [Desulfobacteraceae bacterium IS3]